MSDQPTPNRRTSFTLDIPENVLTCPFWGIRRRGAEIAPLLLNGSQTDDTRMKGIRLWPSGAVTLAPIQTEITNITEYAVGLQYIPIKTSGDLLSKLIAPGILALENTYRLNDDLPGFAASGAIAESGGPFLVKKIPAGATWDNQVESGVANLLGGDASDIPMDRVGESVDAYPAGQAYFLSWDVPGTNVDHPNYTLAFYFGNFGVAFTGSGYAKLYQHLGNPSGGQDWVRVGGWRYAKTGQNSNTAHTLGIWPHMSPTGSRLIAFTNGQVDYAQRISSQGSTTATSVAPGDYVHTVLPVPGYTDTTPPGEVTAAGPFRFDIRRDLRMKLQISLLGWPTTGFLIDDAANLPPSNPHTAVNAFMESVIPAGMTLVPTLLDAATGAAYDPDVTQACQARFDFTSDGTGTPILWGYGMRRDPLSTHVAPGPFSGGNLRGVNVIGYSGDPTDESATLTVADPKGELSLLSVRGQFPAVINVSHVEGGRTFNTPIFRGYVNGPKGTRVPGPNTSHVSYSIPMLGMWMRLAEPTQSAVLQQQFFAELDSSGNFTGPPDKNGSPTPIPWKVTDAIRYLLLCCGFAPEQLAIPDLPMRLWFGISAGTDELNVSPHTDFAEMALGFCRSYLGGYLCYDPTADFWTILAGTPLDAAPIYNFVTAPASVHTVSTSSASYPPLTTFITDLETETVPPEFNVVHVSTGAPQKDGNYKETIERYLYNFASAPIYGATTLPDPTSPDFLGRVREVEIIDPSLVVDAGPDTARQTQAAVDWTARRIYDFCCHAQKLAHFHAPLVFVLDPNTNLWRMLRFGDPVTLNGQNYQVKSVHVAYSATDNQQMATYECIQPVEGQYVPPGEFAQTFRRAALQRMDRKASGATTASLRLGSLAPPPHLENTHRNHPVNTIWQTEMQDPSTGKFYYQMGFDKLGSAPLH